MTDTASDPQSQTNTAPYRVLARKYRPSTFDELVGQEALVRTLANAIDRGRLAHAFILTGVRGIGKTTTARIIARALNCIGADGNLDQPTITPCGVCDPCVSIAEDRHVDVLEMDAASHTGVEGIRDIIDGVKYASVSARYKVYIIDEVHMLSKAAFNALLKTLEEPPEHVKFIFATTEIRKIPVTVLSRCQRFDLRRVESNELMTHFGNIAAKENATLEDEALALIARAADGSVRDGLSLLDRAIAQGSGQGSDQITGAEVRAMLGLADRTGVFDLYEQVMSGDIATALLTLRSLYDGGADPVVVLLDLLDLTHWLTRLKVVPSAAEDVTVPEAERLRGGEMAGKLTMPILSRTWQMLLKGLGEVRTAPSAISAAEMILVRLAYVTELPPPGDLVRRIEEAGGVQAAVQQAPSSATPSPAPGSGSNAAAPQNYTTTNAVANGQGAAQGAQAAPAVASQPENARLHIANFEAVATLMRDQKEALLDAQLRDNVHLVHFEQGRIEIRLDEMASANLPNELGAILSNLTGERWVVSVSSDAGAETLTRQKNNQEADKRREAEDDPLVKAVLTQFPGAKIANVKEINLTPEMPPLDPDMMDPDMVGFDTADFDDEDFDV
ncbi:MAG: DNA polymerase III subunit gamma/tau [Alphaproteobacteria bacterium]|jgi:DNA polymerase III subunit gamma/tau|nr:DNA polymerase III subunit gamma/tau [Alphaproteobacteria bacterium]MBT4017410.1 DNA polymerase III subunit gamma/tau [Alphaproteobacteria bacterium]MBT4965923.1 DNA polymerase III subunit gamma/tau [Alphaproteobacteria bacterium]MBT6386884.1 DNA polymerase III subunit gamma/tau [Alphaproteobacteria bacterium]